MQKINLPLPKRQTRFYGIQRVAALVSLVLVAAQVADPVLNAATGPTQQTVAVTVTDATPGATIYQSTDRADS